MYRATAPFTQQLLNSIAAGSASLLTIGWLLLKLVLDLDIIYYGKLAKMK
jgi:hypothetical protein